MLAGYCYRKRPDEILQRSLGGHYFFGGEVNGFAVLASGCLKNGGRSDFGDRGVADRRSRGNSPRQLFESRGVERPFLCGDGAPVPLLFLFRIAKGTKSLLHKKTKLSPQDCGAGGLCRRAEVSTV